MSRALLRGAVGHSWRHEASRSFLVTSGVPIPRYSNTLRTDLNSRAFSIAGLLRSDRPPESQYPNINLPLVEENVTEHKNTESASTSHVPWYLQEEPIVDEPRPVSGDHIPQIPESSPEMLPTLLEYTYKDLGLDNLKLFDLRGLETPAALGSNVIMIIGTARSVKHLNVSADRLCRWLRSTYKLSPYADGLLGRNELKIKLRRKAKRARAAANAGRMVDEKDDGITTGWICVNAGVVDKGAVTQELSDAGFEGFGQLDTGTNVVVQIFTEEKRAEVDLEGLWQGNFDRAERKRLRELQQDTAEAVHKTGSKGAPSYPHVQKRNMHTRQCDARFSTQSIDADSMTSFAASSASAQESRVTTASLLEMLTRLPHESARSELGAGPDDYQSTLFLRLFHDSLPERISFQELAALRLRLATIAISRQHPAYTKQALFTSFTEYLGNAYELKDELAFDIVSALLTPEQLADNGGQPVLYLPKADMELALQVLDRLSLRGVPILNMKVFNMLYRVAETTAEHPSEGEQSRPKITPQSNSDKEWTTVQRQLLDRLSKIVAGAEVAFDEAEARQLMANQFRSEDYDGFWRLWRQFPLKGITRTSEDYAQLFQLHADLGDERRARECISTWVPMMDREASPVPLAGAIVTPLMHCLLVADSEIQTRAERQTPGYFVDIWSRCQDALAQNNW
ncbi:ATPase synthesis protein 25 [Penicillium hetheringtonii]|uniref:ATPase synthesis protein 25 n=1 Tax=Penicillium hetheringtonii TaxID=911720 RepID=A0AAD6D9D5_9EURO|nr:ATPase synthesis protein 25 [Penicillium hetheringtonii]